MVKFFNRPNKRASKRTADASPNGTEVPPKEPVIEKDAKPARAAKTATRRRTTATRPPRRDWAAEAAAMPIDKPAPAPSSIAFAPGDGAQAAEQAPGAPAKRRRGTRGGRGRKKKVDGAQPEAEEAVEETPQTLEALIARQASVLESFTREVGGAVRELQRSVSDLQAQMARGAAVTSHPRVGVFVDVPNVIYAAERRGVNIDFGKLLEYFTRDRELVRASAYAPITDDPQAKLENQRFVHHFLGHPYRIITKPLKRFADGSMKANFDIELAIDILTMSDRLDVVVLLSGDGDFRRLVELIASRGVRVEVAAFGETVSNELKVVADRYVDLADLLAEFKA